MASLPDVLCAPGTLALLTTHPNTHAVTPTFRIPAGPGPILRAALTDETLPAALPAQLRTALAALRRLARPRAPVALHAPPLPIPDAQGMSPKKAHEVARMAAYVARLAAALPAPPHALRIVDVGAGQGYLTRALKARLPVAHVLALDADAAQTAGARGYERRVLPHAYPPIAHRTILIEPRALLDVVDEWVGAEPDGDGDGEGARVPVLFVALHACGSLTPDILRAFVNAHHVPRAGWYPAGVVAVGCCYNLMDPADFPLSAAYRARAPLRALPPSAFHLAAQVPGTWAVPSAAAASGPSEPPHSDLALHSAAALAIRKVVWRALLERLLQHAVPLDALPAPAPDAPKPKSATVPAHWPRRREEREGRDQQRRLERDRDRAWVEAREGARQEEGVGEGKDGDAGEKKDEDRDIPEAQAGVGATPAMARLGRLRDAAYASWGGFLSVACARMGVQIVEGADADDEHGHEEPARPVLDWDLQCPSDALSDAWDSPANPIPDPDDDDDDPLDHALTGALPPALRARARELAALHVLRCLVGALVEDAVLADRVAWVRGGLRAGARVEGVEVGGEDEQEEGGEEEESGGSVEEDADEGAMRVRLVNLFNQATGSGRNVALVVARALPGLG